MTPGNDAICTLHRGTAPLLVSLPHDGTRVPDDIAARLTGSARRVPDTDWHVARLYAFARELGASVLVPTHSRYVIDLNRSEDDVSLYPGQNTTGLCPVVQFTGEPVYRDGEAPGRSRSPLARRALLAPVPRCVARRTRSPARRPWPRGAVGRPFDQG